MEDCPTHLDVSAGEAAFLSWTIEPLPTLGLLAAALVYFRGWRKLSRQVPARFPLWRLLSFLGGLLAIFVAIASPLDAFASFFLISHMAQHLLFTMIAPPMIWLGAPQLPLLSGLPRRFVAQAVAPFLNFRPLMGIVHVLTHPLVAWWAFVLSNVIWHVPGLYELALRSWFWHDVEHGFFLGTSLLFWWHVVQPWPSRPVWPRWAIIPYLLLADLQNTGLAALLTFLDRVLYPTYAAAPRIAGLSALEDQAGAGALMWVPGSMAFLLPAGFIAMEMLSPKRRQPAPTAARLHRQPSAEPEGDLFQVWGLDRILRWRHFRRALQATMVAVAAVVVWDGLTGPQVSAMNAAGVLPWTHWRTFTVVALLVFGNLFCMACPFTFVRDLGRRVLPARAIWPRQLRGKWIAIGLLVLYFWAYEAYDLWDRPWVTAVVILAYFAGAFLVDGIFRGASFCQYLCPIGQFHFVQSLMSPFEVKVREPKTCESCKTHDCLRGNSAHRGCELHLFQPAKSGNMDCTFCLDCVAACPHDNVGLLPVAPGRDIIRDPLRSTVGTFARRPDIAALVLVLTFAAFANAAGMVVPVLQGMEDIVNRWGLGSDIIPVGILALLSLVIVPAGLSMTASRISGGHAWKEHFCRFSMTLVPLGFGMWVAHFVFHFFTAALTPVPVIHRMLREVGVVNGETQWSMPSWAFYDLPALEIVFLNIGFLACLYLVWRVSGLLAGQRRKRAFLPWGTIAMALYLFGIWIIFQPMQMRGTLMH